MRVVPWLAASIVCSICACTKSHEWPAADRYKGMTECTNASQQSGTGLQLAYCDCAVKEMMKDYGSYEAAAAHPDDGKGKEISVRCADKADTKITTEVAKPATTDLGHRWSDNAESRFLEDCFATQRKQDPYVATFAARYCECAMHRLEIQFPDENSLPEDESARMPVLGACAVAAIAELPNTAG
ncbi:MAG TPA: hypothetical protein VFV70_01550 [Hyphomonadaceae bacterium]|nr:hypothetical protein [Hyphomonadaceae bacterium]